MAAGALVLLFVGLLLPWLSGVVDFLGRESEDGFHSWGWLCFAALVVGVAVLLTRALAGAGQLSGLPARMDDTLCGRVLMAAGVVAILGAALFWATATTGFDIYASIGISGGLIVSLVAGLFLVLGGAMLAWPAGFKARLGGTVSE